MWLLILLWLLFQDLYSAIFFNLYITGVYMDKKYYSFLLVFALRIHGIVLILYLGRVV